MIPVTGFQGKQVAVFGLARTGLSATRALMAGGATVLAADDNLRQAEAAAKAGIPLADLAAADWSKIAALVLAPGIPLTHPAPHPMVVRARANNVEIIGDIELFLRERRAARLVGVTGTNGKSTTTALIGHILKQAGRPTAVGGNIGTPVLDLPALPTDGVYVFEMSSFQIDLTPSWRGDVAILLNITPDHLDRHGDMAGYVAVKRLIFAQARPTDVAVIGVDDPECAKIAGELHGHNAVPVAIGRRLEGGISVVDGRLFDSTVDIAAIDGFAALQGRHNWQNAAAAYAACRALGLTSSRILDGFASFPGLAHRMETVRQVDGITFVNDSKATNADAAAKALACYDNIYWIAGGQPKEGGIGSLAEFFPRIRHAFLIGNAANDFAATLQGNVPVRLSGTLAQAVRDAHRQALADGAPQPVVLLSPACASYDQFRDFEHRGDSFRGLVQSLGNNSNGAAA